MNQGIASALIAGTAIVMAVFALHYRREETLRMLGDDLADALRTEARWALRRTIIRSVAGVVALLGLGAVGYSHIADGVALVANAAPGTTTTRANDIAGPVALLQTSTCTDTIFYDDFESGDFSSPIATDTTVSWTGNADVRVIARNAFAGSYSLESWNPPDLSADSSGVNTSEVVAAFGNKPDSAIWIEYMIRWSDNYTHSNTASSDNNKYALLCESSSTCNAGGNFAARLEMEPKNVGDTISISVMYSRDEVSPSSIQYSPPKFPVIEVNDPGNYYKRGIYAKLSPTVADSAGEFRWYKNDTLVATFANMPTGRTSVQGKWGAFKLPGSWNSLPIPPSDTIFGNIDNILICGTKPSLWGPA